MKLCNNLFTKSSNHKKRFTFFIALLSVLSFCGIVQVNAQSTLEYKKSSDTLVVYTNVPGLTPSDKYQIRVRSAATNNEWVDVFALYTYNRALELPQINPGDAVTVQKYQKHTGGWSHTYGNIEMNNNQSVEVEISAKNGFKIGGKDFFKATVHPAQKASLATLVGGKIYFTITKPAQIVIDINGQMDDYNAAINPIGHPVHAISLFANPVIKKPTLNGSRVRIIEPGTSLAAINSISTATYDTIYFKPGVHDVGSGIKLHPGKTIYIPGDAFIYGSFNNIGVPAGSYSKNGENITVLGYGTICGAKIPHYSIAAQYYPEIIIDGDKPIEIENSLNQKLIGVTLADNANHSILGVSANGIIKWLKTISWRTNGDGLGGYIDAEDCFIRSHDDGSYIKANKRRCTFWKDANAALFHMATIPENSGNPIILEDCDVLYARLRTNPGTNGGGFQQRGEGLPGQRKVNLIIRDFRFHDKLINMPIFSLVSYKSSNDVITNVGSSYTGILFQNISIAGMAPGNTQRILGCEAAPWYGGLIFDNITIGGTKITDQNYKNFFNTNEFVKDIWFRMPEFYKITKNVNSAHGSISVNPSDTVHIQNSTATLTAVANAGYKFSSWSGDTTTTANPISLKMNGNKTITANFITIGAKNLTVTPATNGNIVVNPAGTSQTTNSWVKLIAKAAIGYRFVSWSGDLSSTKIIDSLKMDADKTVSASFVKTNNFAINCGGDQYVAADGTVYAQTPDGFAKTNTISGTSDQFLYQSERSSSAPFSYDIPVDNGEYSVTLKFAEIHWTSAEKRKFNVAVEGIQVLANFDIFVEAGGANKAIDKTFTTTVVDSILNIGFTTVINQAKISAIKVSKSDEVTSAEVSNYSTIPTAYQLFQNYPNPFNPTTTIKYGLPVSGHVKISVYNVVGKEVAVLVDKYQNAGHHEVFFKTDNEGRSLSSGVYFYKIASGSFSRVKKMLILK